MAKTSPAARVRKWRGKRSLIEAAHDLGISAPFLCRVERGIKLPGLLLAERLENIGALPASAWTAVRLERARAER